MKANINNHESGRRKLTLPARILLLVCGILLSANVVAQQITVTGKVVDNSGESMPGVNVVQKGTSKGVVTDFDGNYSISLDKTGIELQYSFVGYITQTILIDGQQTKIDITLAEDVQGIEEVVVVGYGTQKKLNLTGAIDIVKSEDLIKRQTASMSAALQGLAPGVTVQQKSGEPGRDGATINIRGVGSINAGDKPLILVDGIEMDIDQIDMNTVASVSVLKDAASTSIYGSKSANGVILITTKRAKEKGVRVNYNGSFTLQSPSINMPKPLGAVEFMKQNNIAAQLDAGDPNKMVFTAARIQEYETYGADNFNRYDTDWSSLILKDNAWMNSHSLNIAASGDKVKTYAAATYFGQDGIVLNSSDFKRMTLRLNNDISITDWLVADVDINARRSEAVRPNIGDNASYLFYTALNFSPLFAGRYDDGRWGYAMNGTNPAAIMQDGGNIKKVTSEVMLHGGLTITPFKGFEGLISYSYLTNTDRTTTIRKTIPLYEQNRFFGNWPNDGNYTNEGWNNYVKKQFNAQATYSFTLASTHDFKILGGTQTEEWVWNNFSASRRNFPVTGYYYLDDGDAESMANTGGASDVAIASFFGRLNYNYREKYLIEFNARWDGSSRFASQNRWGFFPSVSGGWRISEESFMESTKNVVNILKIRASWGQLGNQALDEKYAYTAVLASDLKYNYFFNKGEINGVSLERINNPNIQWETSEQFNVGIDASFFQSKLSLTADFFQRNIRDMLYPLPQPYMIGYNYPYLNVGVMTNTGWELSVTYKNSIDKINYYITGMISDVTNEVKDLHGQYVYDGNAAIIEGEALKSYYGYKAIGYFQNDTEVANDPVVDNKRSAVQPGDVKFADISGPNGEPDGMIDVNDRVILGNPFPRYEYSLNLGASWKGFDFTVFFQGVGKRDYYISGNGVRPLNVGSNMFEHQLDYWTPDNPDAEYPRLSIDNTFNYALSSKWVKKGSYLRMKNIMLGYTLPTNIINRVFIQNLRVYVSAQNLFTVSNFHPGYDPEVSYSNGSFYPVMKTFTMGVDISF